MLVDGLGMLETYERPRAWWWAVRVFVFDIHDNPVLSGLLPGTNDDRHAWRGEHPRVEWGRASWVHLTRELRKGANELIEEADLNYDVMGGASLRQQWLEEHVRPLVHWLLSELDHGLTLQLAVERWLTRVEWMGPLDEAVEGLIEAKYQADLQRFLFDQGVEAVREHPGSRGRVDFRLRSSEEAIVELKVWRGKTPRTELVRMAHQAASYFGDDVTGGYLVILWADRGRRFRLDGVGPGHGPLMIGSGQLHVRVADVGRWAPSEDAAKRKPVVVITPEVLLGV